MAVSLLAQSLPLAVGYRAAWRKREKSVSQIGILQAALYEEFRDKKGVVLEKKRAGATRPVQDKQGNVLEKKHSGTVSRVQGSASGEIPSDAREATIECDPLSQAPDAGIFVCGVDSHCIESEESELGGFCVAFKQAPTLSRALQSFNCTDGLNGDGATCDCSLFDNTTGLGSYACTYPAGECIAGYPTVCGKREVNVTLTNSSVAYTTCIEPDGGVPAESLCYSLDYNSISNITTCEFEINNVICKSCSYENTCPANSVQQGGSIFDCTNTVVNVKGSTCETGLVGSFFDVGSGMPSSAPLETPSASPVEMPMPATSSGSSHTAKVAIVVSASGAAWLASFGA
jgi:hypothetical protein